MRAAGSGVHVQGWFEGQGHHGHLVHVLDWFSMGFNCSNVLPVGVVCTCSQGHDAGLYMEP